MTDRSNAPSVTRARCALVWGAADGSTAELPAGYSKRCRIVYVAVAGDAPGRWTASDMTVSAGSVP